MKVIGNSDKQETGHEGEVLDSYFTKRRDRKAALKFLRRSMKRHGQLHVIVTDKLRSYSAAMKVIGNCDKQETGRWLNNRCENSHQPFRRRELAMQRFQLMQTLQNSHAPKRLHCPFYSPVLFCLIVSLFQSCLFPVLKKVFPVNVFRELRRKQLIKWRELAPKLPNIAKIGNFSLFFPC